MSLGYTHISKVADEAIKYLDDRRSGKIQSLKTASDKLNSVTVDGFEWNSIITLGGLSGTGKSAVLEQWKREFISCNPNQKFKILSFEFEMIPTAQIFRNTSAKLHFTTKQIKLGQYSEDQFDIVKNTIHGMKNYPVYYVQNVGTSKQVEETINTFVQNECISKGIDKLVVTLDHVLLVNPESSSEPDTTLLKNLYKTAMKLKLFYASIGIKIIFIFASQLNRDIEQMARVNSPEFHFPSKTDLYGSSTIYQGSDYVIITHKPVVINGMPSSGYGADNLPLYNPENPKQPMIYWHIIKNREGELFTLQMVDNLKYSSVEDYNKAN